jgi:hypothetical protein
MPEGMNGIAKIEFADGFVPYNVYVNDNQDLQVNDWIFNSSNNLLTIVSENSDYMIFVSPPPPSTPSKPVHSSSPLPHQQSTINATFPPLASPNQLPLQPSFEIYPTSTILLVVLVISINFILVVKREIKKFKLKRYL